MLPKKRNTFPQQEKKAVTSPMVPNPSARWHYGINKFKIKITQSIRTIKFNWHFLKNI